MKSRSNLFRTLCATALFGVFASFAFAGPGAQYWETLRHESQFKKLKAGDRIAYVCSMCKTVSETPIESAAQAMDFCKEGASVTCPSCKMTTKVTMKQQRNDPPSTSEVVYVNEKGEECAFVAVVSATK